MIELTPEKEAQILRQREARAPGFDERRAYILAQQCLRMRRFLLLTVAVVALAGWIAGQAAPAVMVAPLMPDDLCWRPGSARNIGIAETPCP